MTIVTLGIELNRWFIKKRFGESEEAARVSFFSDDLPQEDLLRCALSLPKITVTTAEPLNGGVSDQLMRHVAQLHFRYMDQFKNSSSVGIISISEFNKVA